MPATLTTVNTLELRCSAVSLRTALNAVSKATIKPGRGARAVLTGVRIDATDTGVRLITTNLALTLDMRVKGAEVIRPGSVILPYDMLKKALTGPTKAKDKPVTIAVGEDRTVVTVGDTSVAMDALDIADWPDIEFKADGVAMVHSSLLDELLPAASDNTSRPLLTGVCIDDTAMVTTDSYRLHAIVDLPSIGLSEPIIVPAEALALATDGDLMLSWNHQWAQVGCTDGLVITARLIIGQYPNWPGLIPVSPPCSITVDRDTLHDAIVDVARFASKGDCVRLETNEIGAVTVVVNNDDVTACRPIPAVTSGHMPPVVAYNPTYFAGLLKDTDPEIVLELTDHLKPTVIRQPAHGGQRIRVIMPTRV